MTDKVEFNPDTRQLRVTWSGPVMKGAEPMIIEPNQYQFNPITGQVRIRVGSETRDLDGPIKTITHGGGRGGQQITYVSVINGKPVKPLPGAGGAFIKGAQQGISLGWSDELEGAVGAVKDKLLGESEGPFSEDYKRRRDDARHEQQVLQGRNPMAYLGGNLAGGIIPAVAAGGATVPGAIGMAGTVGGLSSAGFSDTEDPLQLLKDTAKGTALGAGVATVGATGQTLLNNALPAGRAAKALSPLAAETEAAMMMPNRRPAETSPQLADALRGASHASPTTASKYIDDAWTALDESYGRMQAGVSDMLSPEDAVKLVDRARTSAKTGAKVLYPDAYADPAIIKLPPQILNNPYLTRALPEARNLARADGRAFDVQNLTTEDVHNIRQSLDDLVNAAFKNGKGNVGRRMKDLRDDISHAAYVANPKLQLADTEYTMHMDVVKAADMGMDALAPGKKVAEVEKEFAALTVPQKEAYKVGLATAVRHSGGTTASKRNPEKFAMVPNIQSKLEAVGVPSTKIDDFVDVALGKARFADAVVSGSATGKNLAFKEAIRHPLEDVRGSDVGVAIGAGAIGGPAAAGAAATVPIIRGAGRSFSKSTADRLIKALAAPNAKSLISLMKYGSPQAYTTLLRAMSRDAADTATQYFD